MNKKLLVFAVVLITAVAAFVSYAFFEPDIASIRYTANTAGAGNSGGNTLEEMVSVPEKTEMPILSGEDAVVVTHVETPSEVKGVYVSSWVAGSANLFSKIVKMVDTTELNTVVIDIKDSTGKISFDMKNPDITQYKSTEKRIAAPKKLIADLHSKGIYVVGRLTVFQDPYMAKLNPDWAIKTKSTGAVWKDNKGLSFLDPSNEDVWKYIVDIANESYAMGFDEINFDYIRFPSDGNMKDIAYPNEGGTITRADIMKNFYEHLHEALKDSGMKTSADMFGLVTTSKDDLGIGQVLEKALPYFDYICPMVYPSHYAKGSYNIAEPAKHPYEIVKTSMEGAVVRAKAMGEDPAKLRPWLQDFNLGATYTADMVRTQMQATYDVGLNSWLLWDAANTYTASALLPS